MQNQTMKRTSLDKYRMHSAQCHNNFYVLQFNNRLQVFHFHNVNHILIVHDSPFTFSMIAFVWW